MMSTNFDLIAAQIEWLRLKIQRSSRSEYRAMKISLNQEAFCKIWKSEVRKIDLFAIQQSKASSSQKSKLQKCKLLGILNNCWNIGT